ncbi:hypothetical protein GCM10011492_42730 [Flexivirga endophytica]|uniref:Uncharacterized protein n=1 Tax=Flexivirga endophytica TaxID=1849103 RepID=A0A916TJ77_9MICO|nr:hypothetical protein GCM10011492_42730 [Flexivirga endophytica]GHB67493.1 hypothetical protein GCM10008112_40440 [Flexivirga endophytica]
MRCTQLLVGDGATEVECFADGFGVLLAGADVRVLDGVDVLGIREVEVADVAGSEALVGPLPSLPEPDEQPATTNADTTQALAARTSRREADTVRR